MDDRNVHKQLDYGIRMEWGLTGGRAITSPNGCTVVVDVLSFTTTVSVAVSRGIEVFPYPWRDESAAEFAERNDAELAVGRSEMTPKTPWSLSAAALSNAPFTSRLVLPSPNGSTICKGVEGQLIAGSLRNGRAVANWLLRNDYGTPGRPISVVASGERWTSDASLRPCIEDLVGAGYIIRQLIDAGLDVSPEALIAASTFDATNDIDFTIRNSSSGKELSADGFASDITFATSVDADNAVPLLRGSSFSNAVK